MLEGLNSTPRYRFRSVEWSEGRDITGSEIYFSEGGKREFKFQQGPIFANLILADEINRAPAKVQSALLEAMEERHVTVGGQSYPLPDLFMVMATQNPIEQEGTYPLPEAQLDRFLMHVEVGYPDEKSEAAIMRLNRDEEKRPNMASTSSSATSITSTPRKSRRAISTRKTRPSEDNLGRVA